MGAGGRSKLTFCQTREEAAAALLPHIRAEDLYSSLGGAREDQACLTLARRCVHHPTVYFAWFNTCDARPRCGHVLQLEVHVRGPVFSCLALPYIPCPIQVSKLARRNGLQHRAPALVSCFLRESAAVAGSTRTYLVPRPACFCPTCHEMNMMAYVSECLRLPVGKATTRPSRVPPNPQRVPVKVDAAAMDAYMRSVDALRARERGEMQAAPAAASGAAVPVAVCPPIASVTA